jgi:hypothetical protein
MDVGTTYLNNTNMTQSFQTKENRGSKVDSEQKFEIPYTQEEEKETKESQMDGALADFLKKLREKGAAKFLADLNKEKIEALVQEYKQKLIDNMGDSPEALQDIAKLVEAFKAKLVEEMKEKMEDEIKTAKYRLNGNTLLETHLNSQKRATPLEELLKL